MVISFCGGRSKRTCLIDDLLSFLPRFHDLVQTTACVRRDGLDNSRSSSAACKVHFSKWVTQFGHGGRGDEYWRFRVYAEERSFGITLSDFAQDAWSKPVAPESIRIFVECCDTSIYASVHAGDRDILTVFRVRCGIAYEPAISKEWRILNSPALR